MVELSFSGLSADGSHLYLADSAGKRYTVAIDASLRSLLRGGDTTPRQLEIALNTLGPREIQARLRAGATVRELADEAGVDVERIERYAGPPLAEREHVAGLGQATHLTSHLGDRPLGVVVASAAEKEGVPADLIRWDAWLREDGSWQVLTAYPVGGVDRVATWVFAPRDHHIAADGVDAENMVAGPQSPPQLSSVTEPNKAPSAKKPATKKAQAASGPAENTPADDSEAPARGGRRSKRASVPTWDEILFGGNATED
ncbi:MAG: septation protein SepH [Candidatus Nanopelagicales bacterium]